LDHWITNYQETSYLKGEWGRIMSIIPMADKEA